jgi:hypothetical protein
MSVLSALPALGGMERAVPDIKVHLTTLSTGNTEETLTFEAPGSDRSLALRLPNGATVLSASLDVTGLPLTPGGKDCPENVTVDVGPLMPPEYEFRGKGYGRMGHQNIFTNGYPVLNVTLPYNGGTNRTSAIRLPKDAVVTSAVMNVSSGGSLGGSGKVMLCAADTYTADVQTKLQSFPDIVAVDIVNAQSTTPTLNDLRKYSAVMVWSNYQLADSNTLGNNLADYVDEGGGVILAVFAFGGGGMAPQGRFASGGYLVMPYNGYQYNAGSLGTYIDGHPLMMNVKSFSTSNYRPTSNQVVAGATVVASYSDGIPLIATKNVGGVDRVDLGFFPPSSDTIGSSWSSATDGKHILHNAVAFVGRRAFNVSLDILGDSSYEWSNQSFNSTAKMNDFTGMLNGYLRSAEPNGTDKYGTAYVDVPMSVSSNMSGMLQLCNLSISYDYTGKVENVKGVGTLADSLSELLPSTYDGKYSNITLEVSSSQPGKVRISNVSVVFRPPIHPPFIDSRDPGQDAVFMKENETQHFSINASDEYGYPLSAVWFLDTLEAARDVYNFTYDADFESAGSHVLSVTVNNTMRSAGARWNITVVNVNRPPVVNSFSPGAEVTIREEESVNLAVSASDPDSQDTQLKYNWYVGSTDQGVSGDSFRFKTDLRSAGSYSIRVKVTDAGGLSASQSWQVIVTNVNVPPVVDSLSPNLNPRIKETESVTFSVIASDFDKQLLTYRWYLDGSEAGSGQQYVYRAGYDSAGEHAVQAVISDGETNITRNWTVTVENVNRPPVAVIDRPAGQAEFMDTVSINFSGLSSSDPDKEALRYKWLEGSRELSTSAEFERKFPPGVHEVALEVTDTNRAVSRATVKFTVRYVKLVSNIEWDLVAPVEGNRLTFTAWVNNTGDAAASEVGVEFLVDGQSLGTQTIDSIAGGGTGSATFSWKARKGEHALGVKIGNQSWNSTVAVAQRPAPPASDMTLPLMIGAVAAVAAVGALAFVMTRKKRVQAAPAVPPVPAAPAMAAPPPPAPPAPAAPAVAAAPPPVPTMDLEKRDRVRKLIISTQEKVADLIENPREGVDVAAAMGALEQAQKQLNDGDYDGALRLAKQARSSLAASAAPAAAPAPEPAEAPAQKPRACPKCAERLEPGWGVCPSCGEKV